VSHGVLTFIQGSPRRHCESTTLHNRHDQTVPWNFEGLQKDWTDVGGPGFSDNIGKFQEKLEAKGGGDLPEAVTAALDKLLTFDWRNEATKVIMLITDAPPHGIGEPRDGFPEANPDGPLPSSSNFRT
jgi:hypothetical protein